MRDFLFGNAEYLNSIQVIILLTSKETMVQHTALTAITIATTFSAHHFATERDLAQTKIQEYVRIKCEIYVLKVYQKYMHWWFAISFCTAIINTLVIMNALPPN